MALCFDNFEVVFNVMDMFCDICWFPHVRAMTNGGMSMLLINFALQSFLCYLQSLLP